ncbi:hypothetical protein KAW80_04345 [Candidatus Babeliales bacterium]|nr:hypothetical protein [Candidatus Babeliales bacterium]
MGRLIKTKNNKTIITLSLSLILSIFVTKVSCTSYVNAGGFPEDENKKSPVKEKISRKGFPQGPQYSPPITEEKSDELIAENAPGSKPLVQIRRGDLELTLGGDAKFESFFAKNIVLLNNTLPDEYGFFKQTMDLSADLVYGEKEFGHKAVELFVDLRQKYLWGNTGNFGATTSESIRIDGTDLTVGSHSHKSLRPNIWLRDAWMQLSLNAVFGAKEDKTLHFLKIGFFPFWIGRGISLGPVYGLSKEFLGIYTGYQNDQSAPGINLNGELVKDHVAYDLYYSKLEEKSNNLRETFNHDKYNHVGKHLTPWRGVAKDNDLFALRLKIKPLKKEDKFGVLEFEPYLMYNEASDRTIEFNADAKSELGTGGLGVEYKNGNFEWGTEFAHNFGNETLYHIDRNIINAVRDTDGSVVEKYTKVKSVSAAGSSVAVTNEIKIIVEANKSNITNGAFIDQTAGGVNLYNASDRYRPSYKNSYAGWMFVTDLAYNAEPVDMKFALAYGFASGDENPHGTGKEYSKNYHGFVGLQELYAGQRVPSVLVLDARKIKRPLTVLPDFDREAGDDGSFTDMHYLGFGAKWFPIERNEKKFYVQSNALLFWKDKGAFAYDQANETTSALRASNFLGTEWNIRFKYLVLKDLYAFGDFAIFFPGSYYSDIKGTPLRGDVYNKLDEADKSGIDTSSYRIGTDSAYMLNLGLTYKF